MLNLACRFGHILLDVPIIDDLPMDLYSVGLQEKEHDKGTIDRKQAIYPWRKWPNNEGAKRYTREPSIGTATYFKQEWSTGCTNSGSVECRDATMMRQGLSHLMRIPA